MNKSPRSAKFNRVLVGNLPLEATDVEIYDLLSKAGDVRHIEILCHPKTGKQLGFAEVELANAEHARLVVQLVDGVEMQGRKLSVQPILIDMKTNVWNSLLGLLGFTKRST